MRALKVLTVLLAALTLSTVNAHHSIGGEYDRRAEEITVEGTVKQFDLVNPHIWIILEVENEAGELEEWRVQGDAAVKLRRSPYPWSEDSLRSGDRVTVTGWPAFNHLGMQHRVLIKEDGTVLCNAESTPRGPCLLDE